LSQPTIISLELGRRVAPATRSAVLLAFARNGLELNAKGGFDVSSRAQARLSAKESLLHECRFVVTRERGDRTHRVVFEVPKTLRPPGWPPTIRLPLVPPRIGDLEDPDEFARIRDDAATLYKRYREARSGERCEASPTRIEADPAET
jgi:hypothetical protein